MSLTKEQFEATKPIVDLVHELAEFSEVFSKVKDGPAVGSLNFVVGGYSRARAKAKSITVFQVINELKEGVNLLNTVFSNVEDLETRIEK
jgi:hypothetical protein